MNRARRWAGVRIEQANAMNPGLLERNPSGVEHDHGDIGRRVPHRKGCVSVSLAFFS